MCFKKLTPSKATLISLEELRAFYIASKDGYINFDAPGKITGGTLFSMLDRYLKSNPISVVRIKNEAFREAHWNNVNDTVLLVKRDLENPIPQELKTRHGSAVSGYDVIDQKALSDYQQGYLKITSIAA